MVAGGVPIAIFIALSPEATAPFASGPTTRHNLSPLTIGCERHGDEVRGNAVLACSPLNRKLTITYTYIYIYTNVLHSSIYDYVGR